MDMIPMDDFNKTFTNSILKKIRQTLKRDLTDLEIKVFSLKRPGIAYEMIMDFISEDTISKYELENYVKKVVREYQTSNSAKS